MYISEGVSFTNFFITFEVFSISIPTYQAYYFNQFAIYRIRKKENCIINVYLNHTVRKEHRNKDIARANCSTARNSC